jgi:hypothetical protein
MYIHVYIPSNSSPALTKPPPLSKPLTPTDDSFVTGIIISLYLGVNRFPRRPLDGLLDLGGDFKTTYI